MTEDALVFVLEQAIRGCNVVRLAYRRQADEVVSVHEVAPIDIRGGWTPRTEMTKYLWGWCLAEDRAEMHILARIVTVGPTEKTFEPQTMLTRWPTHRWPIPDEWAVPRAWS